MLHRVNEELRGAIVEKSRKGIFMIGFISSKLKERDCLYSINKQ